MSGQTITYTEDQIVIFGQYLLSDERTKWIKDITKGNHKTKVAALKQVYEQDFVNFNHILKANNL
jgi:hypothetical protein